MFRDWYIFTRPPRRSAREPRRTPSAGITNPVQPAWLLSFTTGLPFEYWVWLMIGVSFLAVAALCREHSHWALLSLPFVFGMTMGSIDLLLWIPARLFGGIGLAFLTLKPQPAIIFVPFQIAAWLREGNRTQVGRFVIATIILWALPVVLAAA